MDTKKQVGQIIKDARDKMSLTQGDLAENINASQQTISKWETGENAIQKEDVKMVCIALGIPEQVSTIMNLYGYACTPMETINNFALGALNVPSVNILSNMTYDLIKKEMDSGLTECVKAIISWESARYAFIVSKYPSIKGMDDWHQRGFLHSHSYGCYDYDIFGCTNFLDHMYGLCLEFLEYGHGVFREFSETICTDYDPEKAASWDTDTHFFGLIDPYETKKALYYCEEKRASGLWDESVEKIWEKWLKHTSNKRIPSEEEYDAYYNEKLEKYIRDVFCTDQQLHIRNQIRLYHNKIRNSSELTINQAIETIFNMLLELYSSNDEKAPVLDTRFSSCPSYWLGPDILLARDKEFHPELYEERPNLISNSDDEDDEFDVLDA